MTGESQQPPANEPDPTTLTTDQMLRAIDNLDKQTAVARESDLRFLTERIDGLRGTLEARLASMEDRHTLRVQSAREEAATALASQSKAIDKAETSTNQAISKAEIATDKRFEQISQDRAQLNDLVNGLMPRAESLAMHEASRAAVVALQTRYDEKLGEVQRRLDVTEGKSGGKEASWGYLIAAVTLVATLLGIVIVVANVMSTQ